MSFFEKRYYEKEMKCPSCKKKSKPIIEKNVINTGLVVGGRMFRVGSGLTTPKKYQLVCPNCKAIIGFV